MLFSDWEYLPFSLCPIQILPFLKRPLRRLHRHISFGSIIAHLKLLIIIRCSRYNISLDSTKAYLKLLIIIIIIFVLLPQGGYKFLKDGIFLSASTWHRSGPMLAMKYSASSVVKEASISWSQSGPKHGTKGISQLKTVSSWRLRTSLLPHTTKMVLCWLKAGKVHLP